MPFSISSSSHTKSAPGSLPRRIGQHQTPERNEMRDFTGAIAIADGVVFEVERQWPGDFDGQRTMFYGGTRLDTGSGFTAVRPIIAIAPMKMIAEEAARRIVSGI